MRLRRTVVSLAGASLLALAGCSGAGVDRSAAGEPEPGTAAPAEGGAPTTAVEGPDVGETGQRTKEPQAEGPQAEGPQAGEPQAGEPQAEEPQTEEGVRPDRGVRAPARLQRQVAAMSVRELAHRLLVVTVAGTLPRRVDPAAAAANLADFGVRTPAAVARRFGPGGIVYFDDNVRSVAQVRSLSGGIHAASRRSGSPTLLFTDQEGGSVSRLPGQVSTGQPAARDLGGDPGEAYESARRVGAAMASMGLDVDFAPVADVDTVGGAGAIGDRAFGTGPEVVSRMVRAQTCGYHDGGVAVTLKHWPGHGSTSVDSHAQLPTLTLPEATWRREHLPPFVAGIRRGADLVMIGHLAYPRLDPSGLPATLSREMTTGWLRQRLGFGGVIVTDSLEMDAIAGRGTSGEVAVEALRAGADLLLMSPSPQGATSGIAAAVDDGRLSRQRLEESVLRVLRLADATGLARGPATLERC